MSQPAHAGRFLALGGLVGGLAASPELAVPRPSTEVAGAIAMAWGLLAARYVTRSGERARIAWRGGALVAALATGLAIGAARTAAIDGGALVARPGEVASVRGFVAAVPRRIRGEVRVRLNTADGRLLAIAPEPVPDLPVGHEVAAHGVVREPAPVESGYLARYGVSRVVAADELRLTGHRRGGPAYLLDRVRERGEVALERGTSGPESALLRGFVLGQDDRIDPATVEDFQRSGLAHLLAVSGQNVLLLALLAAMILALLGVPLRARLLCLLAIIAIYVPVAGAGPSIQRAGVMGAAGIVALLAGRPASRWYALLLAASVTLALNPRAAGDAGWQLSFAAVAGIALWAAPLRDLWGGGRGPARRALAEAVAVTVAATIATAPLMAHHFERLSVAALPANLIALPAVAPVMWLGMLAAAVGQVPSLPVEPLTWLAGLFAAYIAQVAHWLAAPEWAQLAAPLRHPAVVAAIYGVLVGGGWLLASRRAARRGLSPRGARPAALAVCVVALLAGLAPGASSSAPAPAPDAPALIVRVIDVGQGDAILLDPAPGDPVLVDTGPADARVDGLLADLGVERLAAVVITHDQADHAGGLPGLLAGTEIGTLAYAGRSPALLRQARAAGVNLEQVAAGERIRSGSLRLTVIWPPQALLDAHGRGDPNARSIVALAHWGAFEMLLTGDAEAEAVPLDPGPIDVLKIAHHGSEDEGLEALLSGSAPALAVISVGEDNPFGHPAPATLATLAEHDVPVLRTDAAGSVTIGVTASGRSVGADQ